jgi:hypothetical protein
MPRRWLAMAVMALVATAGCAGGARHTGSGADPGTAGNPRGSVADPSPTQRSLLAIAVVACVLRTRPPTSIDPTAPQPAHKPESPDAAAARCAEQLRTTLDSLRTQGMYQPATLRSVLTSAGLQHVEIDGGRFGGALGLYCVYGEHTAARTVVDYGTPTRQGSCLR